MTDNEIIKALECCGKDEWYCDNNCLFFKNCSKTLMAKSSLNLITHQKAEIERLKEYNENLQTANTALSNEILEIKSEATKEFAERLKEKVINYKFESAVDGGFIDDLLSENTVVEIIDDLVKEMMEVSE